MSFTWLCRPCEGRTRASSRYSIALRCGISRRRHLPGILRRATRQVETAYRSNGTSRLRRLLSLLCPGCQGSRPSMCWSHACITRDAMLHRMTPSMEESQRRSRQRLQLLATCDGMRAAQLGRSSTCVDHGRRGRWGNPLLAAKAAARLHQGAGVRRRNKGITHTIAPGYIAPRGCAPCRKRCSTPRHSADPVGLLGESERSRLAVVLMAADGAASSRAFLTSTRPHWPPEAIASLS